MSKENVGSNGNARKHGGGRKRTGQLVWCKSGWRARVTVVVDGERIRRLVDLGTSYKPVARRKLARILSESDTSETTDAPPKVTTLDDFAEVWLERRNEQGKTSVESERILYRNYCGPELGQLPLASVGQGHVHALLSELRAGRRLSATGKRLSRASVKHVHGVLLRIFKSALGAGLVSANPVSPIELSDVLPEAESERLRAVLTDSELRQLLAFPNGDIEVKMLVLMSRTIGGMRAGDLNGLDWESFGEDFATCRVPRRKTKQPKELDVHPEVRPFIRAWWEAHDCPTSGPVFPVRRGPRAGEAKRKSNMSYAERLRRELKRALGVEVFDPSQGERGRWVEKPIESYTPRERVLFLETEHSRPVDFHSCRRAFATALAKANVNAQVAQVLTGHSDSKVHMRYVAATTIRALPAEAAPDLSAVPLPQKAATLPFGRRRLSGTVGFSNHSGRGGRIRTGDPLTPSQVR